MTTEDYAPAEGYTPAAIFYQKSTKEYVTMSDGAELLILHKKTDTPDDSINIVFIPGFSTGPYSWNDLWDCLHEEYNLYVVEKRELKSSKVKWKHKANMDRLAEDIENIIESLNLDLKRTVLMGTCLGSSIIGRVASRNNLQFLGLVLMNPPRKFFLPMVLLPIAYITPSFFMSIIGKPLIKTWMKLSLPPSQQREIYMETIRNANGMRWKKYLAITRWDSFDDYAQITSPTFVLGASEDKVHEDEIAREADSLIKNSEFIASPSYYWMHFLPGAEEFTAEVNKFIKKLSK
jgi:pimeloyl-ACP methyl ester carboxylesterase